uniref:Vesicle-fusing ATPase n=1 Tax=Astyanax mexicanus TaxID=7994 RepID=A0A8B9K0H8_ASTMX
MVNMTMQAARCPTDDLSLTNCVVANERDLKSGQHVMIRTTPTHKYVFTVKTHQSVVSGTIAFSLPQKLETLKTHPYSSVLQRSGFTAT